MQYNSNFSNLSDDKINRLISKAFGSNEVTDYCNEWEHAGGLLSSPEITANISFGKEHLSTSMYGDSYLVKRTDNLCRDISELYLVNHTTNIIHD